MRLFRQIAACAVVLAIVGCRDNTDMTIASVPSLPQAVLTPDHYAAFIASGARKRFTVTVDMSNPPPSAQPVDVALIFDSSSSMERQIDPVRREAVRIVNGVRRQFMDARFLVADFDDYYPLHTSNRADRPWTLRSDFTGEANVIADAIGGITVGFGGDPDEAYGRAVYEASQLAWRRDALKIAVFFGDSVAHAIDPGRDGRRGTADDLTFDQAAQALAAAGVLAIGIFDPTAPAVTAQFQHLAHVTGGQAIPLQNASDAAQALLHGLATTLALKPSLRVPDRFRDRVSAVSPVRELSPTRFAFDVDLVTPDKAPAGRARLYLTAHHGDAPATAIGHVNVVITTGWLNDVHWLVPLLAALGLLPLAWLAHSLTRPASKIGLYYFNPWGRLRALAGPAAALAVSIAVITIGTMFLRDLADPARPTVSERFEALLAHL